MPFLDFSEIKKNNPIEQVAERLGLEFQKRGNQLRGKCPSGDGGDRGLVITPAKQAWYSFAKQQGGDVIQLVSFVKGIPVKEAAEFLQEPSEYRPSTSKSKQNSADSQSNGFRPLEYLIPDHEAVVALGFNPIDAEKIGCGFAPRGVMRGTVAVPIRLDDGTLCGYLGITEARLPKNWSL